MTLNPFSKFYDNCRVKIAFLLGKYGYDIYKSDEYFVNILDYLTLKYLSTNIQNEDAFILNEIKFYYLKSISIVPLFQDDILTTIDTFVV